MAAEGNNGVVDVTPSASRLTTSLRDIGYDFVGAMADLVDNCVSAEATKIDIEIVFDGLSSYVLIADDGVGMTGKGLDEALRFGTRREYQNGDLGRYGLGLKTASISQCRRLTVVTRRALQRRRLAVRTLDVDHIQSTDRWEITDPPGNSQCHRALEWLEAGTGTVVVWEKLDRVLTGRHQDGGWARRRLDTLSLRTADYLGMVFHRFLDGATPDGRRITISVNGEKVRPWDPFAPDEEHCQELPPQLFEVAVGTMNGYVSLRRYVLPSRRHFSSQAEFDRLSGPLKWNRQQGLYIYRAHRLIQSGGWCGVRAADEHTKFARASLDFPRALDQLFQINVAKMRVALPTEIRTQLERPIHELCHQADAAYRREETDSSRRVERDHGSGPLADSTEIGSALMAAALEAGVHEPFALVMDTLQRRSPGVARALGW